MIWLVKGLTELMYCVLPCYDLVADRPFTHAQTHTHTHTCTHKQKEAHTNTCMSAVGYVTVVLLKSTALRVEGYLRTSLFSSKMSRLLYNCYPKASPSYHNPTPFLHPQHMHKFLQLTGGWFWCCRCVECDDGGVECSVRDKDCCHVDGVCRSWFKRLQVNLWSLSGIHLHHGGFWGGEDRRIQVNRTDPRVLG